jgi:hypothetical protein
MKLTVREYINDIKKEGHTKVYYKFNWKEQFDSIEDFLDKYGHYQIDINGDFHDCNGFVMSGTFIWKTA